MQNSTDEVTADYSIRLWDALSGQEIAQLLSHNDNVRELVFSTDGAYLASASDDRTARLWDIETQAAVQTFQGHKSDIPSVVFAEEEQSHRHRIGSSRKPE